jgi:flagellar M-ring protein FliF
MEGELSVQNKKDMPDKAIQITKTIVSQLSILFGLAAVLALSVAVIMWAMKPEYTLLSNQLSDSDITSVSSVLLANQIPFKIDQLTGNLLVANDRKHEARLLISAEGLPNASATGYELLKNDSALGTSQFLETARYQHALETELSRSISSMRNIESARVHLALPKRTAFVRKSEKSSASVMVKVSSGRELDRGQVSSIVHLVASSVPYLDNKNVTVVDQWGNLLSADGIDEGIQFSQRQFSHKKDIENLYVQRIESMLAPIFGYGRVKVQVNAEMDFTRVESTQELFDSDGETIRSEQLIDQQQTGVLGAIGIPGALTNQPPAGGTVNVEPTEDGEEATPPQPPTNTNRNSVRNFELDKTIRHVMEPIGKISRMTVAVVADDWVNIGDNGQEQRTPLEQADIELISGIVREAIGYDELRGDRISVYNKSFQQAVLEELPEIPLWKQDWFMSMAKQGIAVIIILLIIFTIVRPTMKTLRGRYMEVRPGSNQLEVLSGQDNANAAFASDQRMSNQAAQAPGHPNYVEQLAMAKKLVSQDPQQVAKVVKTWVANNG